jgi:hypothetical protein
VHVRHCQQGGRLLAALLAREARQRRAQAGRVQQAAQQRAALLVLRAVRSAGRAPQQLCAQRRARHAGAKAQARAQRVAVLAQRAALPQGLDALGHFFVCEVLVQSVGPPGSRAEN